jgi:hypothetical protein
MTELVELSLTGCAVCDLSPLANLTELQSLSLSGCEEIEDLLPLRGMTKLQQLILCHCTKIKDLTPLAQMPNLGSLHLDDCWRVPVPLREAVEAQDFGRFRTILKVSPEIQSISHLPER